MKIAQALILSALITAAAPAQSASPPARPNVHLRVSDWLVNAGVQESRDEVQPVQDCILGTWFIGMGRSRGTVRAELVPDPHHASFDIVLGGCSYSETIGYSADIRISAATTTPFELRKRVCLDGKQLRHGPADGSASALSEFVAITNTQGSTCTLPVLAARLRACQDKSEGEAVASDLTRCRLSAQLDSETYPYLVDASRSLVTAVRHARQIGLSPEPFDWSTSAHHIDLKVTVPAASQPAISSPAPAFAPRADISLAVHQSLVNELIHLNLAGKTLSLSRIADLQKGGYSLLIPPGALDARLAEFEKFLGTLSGLGIKPLSLIFADRSPVTIAFSAGEIIGTVHGVQVKSGDTVYPALDIKVSYRIERTANGYAIVRQGAVQILARSGSPSVLDVAIRPAVQTALNLLLVDRLAFVPLNLPGRDESKSIRVSPLPAEVSKGWLQLAWIRQGK